MGEIDIDSLFRIYNYTKEIIKNYELPFHFQIDSGTYETAIEFVGVSHFHPPISENWQSNPTILCPDLLDYHNKIIIEYEEEVGNRKPGAKLAKKGHNREGDYDKKKDERRNLYYKRGGFRVLRIWESDVNWQEKIKDFLLKTDSINIE